MNDQIFSFDNKNLSSVLNGGLRQNGLIKFSQPLEPLITIITATYNDSYNLTRTINSIRNLKYKNFEWIIIDGASTDKTIEVLRQNDDVIDYWVSEQDNGIYDAWNKGLFLARGEWIAFLGAGDTYQSNALDIYVQGINESHPKLEFVCSRVRLVDEKGLHLRTWGSPFRWKTFKKYMAIAHVGSLHHKLLFERNGVFSSLYSSSSDYEFFMRYGPKLSVLYLDIITADQLIGGISNNYGSLYETYLVHRKYGQNFLIAQFRYQLARAKRRLRPLLHGY